MTTQIKPEEVPDSPAWWNRQITYIMDESFHALKQATEAPDEEKRISWTRRAKYLRNKAIECINNAYDSIQLQKEEDKKNE
tara:strand:- start:491 stop:733 length:243 start_codon:yes stop_codon:yes gene_type:complete